MQGKSEKLDTIHIQISRELIAGNWEFHVQRQEDVVKSSNKFQQF